MYIVGKYQIHLYSLRNSQNRSTVLPEISCTSEIKGNHGYIFVKRHPELESQGAKKTETETTNNIQKLKENTQKTKGKRATRTPPKTGSMDQVHR